MATKLLALPLLLLILAADLPQTWEQRELDYLRTVDGDTFMASIEDIEFRVRLSDVEAPELREGTSAAFEAAAKLARRLEKDAAVDGRVTVWVDLATRRRDKYGRLLARLDPPELK
jgi:endonuclease YncB( thermonuclease family)